MCARQTSSGGINRRAHDKAPGGDQSKVAKIGLISAVVVALISGAAAVVVALITKGTGSSPASSPPVTAMPEPGDMPRPTCATCFTGGKTFTEQAGSGTSKPTFRDPRYFKGPGPSVQPGQRIEVVCRFLDPNAPPSVKPGWWYLIATAPWNRNYYTVANSYLNGDPPDGPFITDVDNGVPVC
jgi:hypothetical protein